MVGFIKDKFASCCVARKHACTLNFGSDSMLPKNYGKKNFCHNFQKLNLVAQIHPESAQHFVSYPAIVAERQRQIMEGGPWLIHPYSLLSLFWNGLMALINLTFIVMAPLRFSFVFPTQAPDLHTLDIIIIGLKGVIFIDIIIKFNMGFHDLKEDQVVMVKSRIAFHYLRTWFIVDFLSCLPLGFTEFWFQSPTYHMFIHMIACIRCLRIATVHVDLAYFCKILRFPYLMRTGLAQFLFFYLSMHLCSCLLYAAAIIQFYRTGKKPEHYCKFLEKENGDITQATFWHRYEMGLLMSCAAFFGTGYSLFKSTNSEEIVINGLIILYGSIFMVYNLVVLLQSYMTIFNARIRYHELMNQTEKYMRQKQFPASMKERVRIFYNYRYQERYFKEHAVMSCLSEQLRNEIILDTCHKLIDKVPLFEGVPPSVVGTVLGCLKPEVYMPNDLVVVAGDEGYCMYFIASGTVAVYSLKGAEVCHLEDGAHFGEVALLMKDRKRVATVVAIEITQLYRLDDEDFREFIMSYKELNERVEILASQRMHETVLIDEAKGSSFS